MQLSLENKKIHCLDSVELNVLVVGAVSTFWRYVRFYAESVSEDCSAKSTVTIDTKTQPCSKILNLAKDDKLNVLKAVVVKIVLKGQKKICYHVIAMY